MENDSGRARKGKYVSSCGQRNVSGCEHEEGKENSTMTFGGKEGEQSCV